MPRSGARELLKQDATARLRDADADIDSLPDRFDPRRIRIVVDASGSEGLALRHPAWLAQGIHVVTASKRGQGASLARWRAIDRAAIAGATRYGDSATVGAGLPLLRTLRGLRAGGDRIHAIAGILSGSLAWLLSQYDGSRAFSALIREARERGLTEPDPRDDLTGTDVRRKLLILARAAGHALEEADVATQTLLTSALALLPPREALDALELLDGALHARWLQARREGRVLRHVARFDPRAAGASSGVASVGIEALAPDDPLAQSTGCDNRVAIWSDRYPTSPLVIQGPGAGADVTAAALLDDIVEICGGVVGASVGIR